MEKYKSDSIGLAGNIFLVFLILKLTDTIDWSWWWVTSPLWLPTVLILLILGVIGVVGTIMSFISKNL